MLKKFLTNPFFVFPLISCLVFWPFTFQLFSLKNDALTYYYPIRTLISDALNNGELPLWTPFINMGYPLHADMQSGAWNPIVWTFAFLTKYNLAAFHYELLLYISFAGIGFYYLCRELGCSRSVAYTMAIAYQLSGFMIDSVQFFTCISSACYIPYVFIFFRRMMQQYRMKDALLLSLFLFLLFTGGYPSLFIITSYVLFAYLLFRFFGSAEKKSFVRKTFFPLITACVFFILLSLPAIVSFILHLPEIERGKSQSLSVVLENSMNPASMLSLVSPFAVTANDSWLNSSILMRNIYMGIIPLIFLIYAFFNEATRKNKEIIFFFCCAMIMLGLAWGKFFFLRQAVYYTLPLMNSFRHPALFRLFSIFFLLLIAAVSFNAWRSGATNNSIKKIILTLLGISLIIGVISILTLKQVQFIRGFNTVTLKEFLFQLNFSGRYMIQSSLILLMLLLSYYALVKIRNTKLACLVLVADMFFAAQLNMPVTVYGAKSFSTIEETIDRNPVTFPLPGNRTIAENCYNSFDPEFPAGSKLSFSKKIGRNDHFITPGNLLRQDGFYESPMRDLIFKNPLLYFADTVIPWTSHVFPDQKNIAFNDDLRIKLNIYNHDSSSKISITGLSANELNASISKKDQGVLVYLQNRYYGWHAYIDNNETAIFPVNTSFMAIQVPAGEHSIRFKYRPEAVINAWHIAAWSFILMFVLYCYLLFSSKRSAKRQTGTA